MAGILLRRLFQSQHADCGEWPRQGSRTLCLLYIGQQEAEGARLLADHLGTEIGAGPAFTAAMGVVRIPTPAPATAEWAQRLRRRLLDARTDAPVHALDGAIWLRLSAFAYNELSDFEALASVVASVL